MRRLRIVAVCVVLGLTLVACGETDPDAASQDGSSESGGFGETATSQDATKTVGVKALALTFDPSSVSVQQGDVVKFVVTNEGKAPHEFVIGDEAYQEEHEESMEHGGHDMELGNSVAVAPGETAELTWRFTSPGRILFACHVAGHYEGGMVGTILVGE